MSCKLENVHTEVGSWGWDTVSPQTQPCAAIHNQEGTHKQEGE